MLFLLNGGASVALLAYLGNVAAKVQFVPDMQWPMVCFVIGLFCCSLTMLFSYLTQYRLYNEEIGRQNASMFRHTQWLGFGIISAILSIFAFIIGSLWAVAKFT